MCQGKIVAQERFRDRHVSWEVRQSGIRWGASRPVAEREEPETDVFFVEGRSLSRGLRWRAGACIARGRRSNMPPALVIACRRGA